MSVNRTGRVRPIQPGISVGHYQSTAGTLGLIVQDDSGNVYILSNNHVLANSNQGKPGDPVLQPGPYDGGTLPDDEVATLTRFVPIRFSPFCLNYMDVAIAQILQNIQYDHTVLGIGAPAGVGDPTLNMQVQKSGRTTAVTYGTIIDDSATVQVQYGLRIATFTDVIVIQGNSQTQQFVQPGDSGSIVMDMNNIVVGEIFAGGLRNGNGIAFKARRAFNTLHIKLL